MSSTIVPAVLTSNVEAASRAFGAYQPYSRAVHVDILDNTLVKGNTLKPADFPKFDRNVITWHLMVSNPIQYVDACLEHRSDAILIHAEIGGDLAKLADEIHTKGVQAGITLNPRTPVELVAHVLPAFDWVQVMTVEPGKQGGEFLVDPLLKLPKITTKFPRLRTIVDGGVNASTIHQVIKYRPAMISVGSYLTPGPELQDHWKELQRALE